MEEIKNKEILEKIADYYLEKYFEAFEELS
ncbi:hypothetical protein M2102_001691 [Fusobacterium sp. PH5-7]|nr:hypothetical protein [Fusobacterium sp. PH5-7]